LGGNSAGRLKLYASGGDAAGPEPMLAELGRIHALGIDLLKIRARKDDVDKTVWCQRHAADRGIGIAVDMTQNLAVPSQSVAEVVQYLEAVRRGGGAAPLFLEEALGPQEIRNLPALRRAVSDT